MRETEVSVLFNEPKLLKCDAGPVGRLHGLGFSALQRAEIAEMKAGKWFASFSCVGFSALQRAEIAEIDSHASEQDAIAACFSALQRAEIAEI